MNSAIAIIFTSAYLLVTIFICRKIKIRTFDLCLCGIAIALTMVLESIRIPLPTGTTLPFASAVPLMLVALICNPQIAIIAGFVCAPLAMVLIPGWQPVHWAQFFVEHMVCFSCLGYAGIFGCEKRLNVLFGILIASALKIFGHIISGVVFFSQNAWDGWGAWGYSLAFNFSQNIPLCIMSGIVIFLLPLKTLKKITLKKT